LLPPLLTWLLLSCGDGDLDLRPPPERPAMARLELGALTTAAAVAVADLIPLKP
jgi:hypothetical protein